MCECVYVCLKWFHCEFRCTPSSIMYLLFPFGFTGCPKDYGKICTGHLPCSRAVWKMRSCIYVKNCSPFLSSQGKSRRLCSFDSWFPLSYIRSIHQETTSRHRPRLVPPSGSGKAHKITILMSVLKSAKFPAMEFDSVFRFNLSLVAAPLPG